MLDKAQHIDIFFGHVMKLHLEIEMGDSDERRRERLTEFV